MGAMAALTSLGTTSPRNSRQQAMYLPWRGSHFTIWFAGSKQALVTSATLSYQRASAHQAGYHAPGSTAPSKHSPSGSQPGQHARKYILSWLVSWVINFLMDWFVGWFVGWLVGVSWC